MTDTVSFDVTAADKNLLRAIGARARAIQIEYGTEPSPALHHEMNVTAAHANGCPLDLERLLAADKFNFSHDVFGIDRHICRETGKLLNCFSPRFSSREAIQ